jgi:hypothetical protein
MIEMLEGKGRSNWPGFLDDFKTFRIERPAPEFFDYLAA